MKKVPTLDEIRQLGLPVKTVTLIGGPSTSPLWSRVIAEACGVDIRSDHSTYAGAFGSACIAHDAIL